METLDLKAEICPHVMSLLRQCMTKAVECGYHGDLEIHSIETELEPKLALFINAMDYPVDIISVKTQDITKSRMSELRANGDIEDHILEQRKSEAIVTLSFRGD